MNSKLLKQPKPKQEQANLFLWYQKLGSPFLVIFFGGFYLQMQQNM